MQIKCVHIKNILNILKILFTWFCFWKFRKKIVHQKFTISLKTSYSNWGQFDKAVRVFDLFYESEINNTITS